MTNVPLTREESQFLIGLFMRLPLVDVIMARAKDGSNPLANGKTPAIEEALSMKWLDYVEKLMLPLEKDDDANVKNVKDLAEKYSIGAIEKQLRADGRIRLLHNKNDFLLEQGDIGWYGEILGERGVFLDKGGHLGNIFASEYKNMLLKLAE